MERTIDLTDIVNDIAERAQVHFKHERYAEADALFAEFSEWFVTGSDADHTVLSLPRLAQ